MIEKAFLGFIGAVVLVTLAAVGVVAAAYGLFEALRPLLGAAGAAGAVAGGVFLIFAVIALVIAAGTRPRRRAASEGSPTAKLVSLAREKPILAAAAIVAVGVVVARNPRLAATAVSAFMAGRADRKS